MATKVERHLLRINADRSINVETDIPIVAGSIGVDEVLITFEEPEDWQDMSLTVTMVSSVVDTPYTVLWDGVSAFNVPWELTQEVGVIGFSVLGISSSSQTYQRGLTQSSVGLITIVTPGINVGEPPVEPTPSAYERVLAMIQSLPEVENRAEAVINDLDNAFRGVAQYLPVGMGNVITAELDGEDSELVSVSDAFKNGKLLGAKVYGKSKQFSTTGAQLLDDSTSIVGHYIDASGDERVTSTSTEWKCSDFVPLNPNAQYTFTVDTTAGNSAKHAFYDTDKTYIDNSAIDSGSQTFTTPSGTAYGRFSYRVTTVNPMLNAGSTALPWEPYTGGIASPNPDYPQEIKSVAEGDIKLTGKCIWGGEQMADDIVAAINNPNYAWKGEDSFGKYVAIKGYSASSSILFHDRYDKIDPNIQCYFVNVYCTMDSSHPTLNNFAIRRGTTLSSASSSNDTAIGSVENYAVYKYTHSIAPDMLFTKMYAIAVTRIYYEQSGLFIGQIGVDDFTPYSGDTLHFLPDDVEPLRSLPDGTRDVLTIDANGNGVIERNVRHFVLDGDLLNQSEVTVGTEPNSNNLYNNVMTIPTAIFDRVFANVKLSGSSTIGELGSQWTTCNYGLSRNNSFSSAQGAGVTVNVGSSKNIYLRTNSAITLSNYVSMIENRPIVLNVALLEPETEIIPASRMPKVLSQYLHAWLEAKDQNGEEIVTDYSVYYEKSIGALMSQVEQALDAAGYPITDYEPEDAMSVAPVLSNDANPVTDAQMAAAVTYGFTLN